MIVLKVLNPKGSIVAMTIAPFLLIRKGGEISEVTKRHEHIHVRQQIEMLWILFFAWYGVEWVIRRLGGDKQAYRHICFERDAYAHEEDVDYFERRRFWGFLKWV